MTLDPELAELFATVPTPTISAVLNGMGIRAWLSGGPGIGVTPLDPDNAAFVATAFTMRASMPSAAKVDSSSLSAMASSRWEREERPSSCQRLRQV